MRENEVEKQFVEAVRAAGGQALKFTSQSIPIWISPVRCPRRMQSSISSQKTPKYKKLGKKEKQPKIFRS